MASGDRLSLQPNVVSATFTARCPIESRSCTLRPGDPLTPADYLIRPPDIEFVLASTSTSSV